MSQFLDPILHLAPWLVLLIVGLLVFAEDAIFVGFVIPGETAAVLAGVAAFYDRVPLAAAIAVVVTAAIVGDSVGYEVGRKFFGPKVLESRFMKRHRKRISRAEAYLQAKGGMAVFLGRFTAFFRAMMPALAGSSRMPYPRFLAWNAVGGIVWGAGFVVLGYLAGSSYHLVEKQVGRGLAILVAVIVVLALTVWHFRRERHEEEADTEESAPSSS